MKITQKEGVQIRRARYENYSDHESVTVFHTDKDQDECYGLGTPYSVWKRKSKSKFDWEDSDSTGDLFKTLSELIERLSEDIAPNEEKAIKTLGGWIIRVLNERLKVSEETKTRRNKLVRYLRKEIEELRK